VMGIRGNDDQGEQPVHVQSPGPMQLHPPPPQVSSHCAPAKHVTRQLPAGQSIRHFDLFSQVSSHPPLGHGIEHQIPSMHVVAQGEVDLPQLSFR
jgi:hypothetical protein